MTAYVKKIGLFALATFIQLRISLLYYYMSLKFKESLNSKNIVILPDRKTISLHYNLM